MSKSQRILSYASSHNAARSRRSEQVPQLSPQQSMQGSLVKTFKQYNMFQSNSRIYAVWQLFCIPGSVARYHTCLTDSMSCSWGACRTIVVDPTTQRTQPSIPNICNFSCKIKCASTELHSTVSVFSKLCCFKKNTTGERERELKHSRHRYLKMILSAPKGVTRIAGANA